jgi:hypothetical protein
VGYLRIGSILCGEIAEEYREKPEHIGNLMIYWAQGFMSGVNAAKALAAITCIEDLQTMTVEAQLHSLTEYCDEYPMANFSKAVIDLYRKLPLKKYTPPASTSQ